MLGGVRRRVPLLHFRSMSRRPSSTHAVALGDADSITLIPKAPHTASLIFMHGLGDTAHGWADSILHIAQRLPHLKCVLPTAPTQPVTLNMGMAMPSWYDIRSLTDREGDPCSGIDASRERIENIIQAEIDGGISPSRIVLGGFSQGGAMSLYTGYQLDKALGGILVLSGYLPNQEGFHANAVTKNVPLLMCHGEDDMVVRLDWAKRSLQVLKAANAVETVDFKVYPDMEHSASLEELDAIERWLKKRVPHVPSS